MFHYLCIQECGGDCCLKNAPFSTKHCLLAEYDKSDPKKKKPKAQILITQETNQGSWYFEEIKIIHENIENSDVNVAKAFFIEEKHIHPK